MGFTFIVTKVHWRKLTVMTTPNNGNTDEFRSQPPAVIKFAHDDSSDVGVTITNAMAAVRDTQIDDLQPLAETVNPELLDQLSRSPSGKTAALLSVSFVYEEHPVLVTHEGEVRIYSPDALGEM